MRTKTVLPYLAALFLLAWILGTLARTGTEGTGILANSYWLVYLVYLLPIFALGAMIAVTIYLVINWKLISDVLGFTIAQQKKRAKKQSFKVKIGVWTTFWAIAIAVLYYKCGGIFCPSSPNNSTETLPQMAEHVVSGGPAPQIPLSAWFTGPANALAILISSPIFSMVFLGVLIVSTLIIVRAVKVSFDEVRNERVLPVEVFEEGAVAVQEALKVFEMKEEADPRTRIMLCYERMIRAAKSLGANVGVDQTARELERGIRGLFQLKGEGIGKLTRLFEEARYSLHTMTEAESEEAQQCLQEIGIELNSAIILENSAETRRLN